MNELATTSAQIEKPVLAARIVKNGTQLLEDYVLWHKCGWSDAEFGELLGISAKTVKNRYLADARKQGLIEKHFNSRSQQNSERARNRARPVENSVPEGTTEKHSLTLTTNYGIHTNPEPERVSSDRIDTGGISGPDELLARHWSYIQGLDVPDSFKRAQERLSEFEQELRQGLRDGWTADLYAALHEDLASYARRCKAAEVGTK